MTCAQGSSNGRMALASKREKSRFGERLSLFSEATGICDGFKGMCGVVRQV
jgi:hypothetical protein